MATKCLCPPLEQESLEQFEEELGGVEARAVGAAFVSGHQMCRFTASGQLFRSYYSSGGTCAHRQTQVRDHSSMRLTTCDRVTSSIRAECPQSLATAAAKPQRATFPNC